MLGAQRYQLALGEWGASESFLFPSAQEYAGSISQALSALREGGGWAVDDLAPPVQASYHALVSTVEVSAGANLGTLISRAIPAAASLSVQSSIGDLVAGGLQFAAQAGSEALAEELTEYAADAMEVVPILGKVVSIVIGIVVDVFHSAAQAEEECVADMDYKLNGYCEQLATSFRVESTVDGPPSPADNFRQISYAYQSSGELPLTPASMFVLLCGGESEGFGFKTDAQYRSWLRREMSPIGQVGEASTLGVEPVDLRRKMWKLIKGIMAAVERPGLGIAPTGRDQGRALMPLLQEIVRQQSLKGRLPPRYLRALSDYASSQYWTSIACSGGGGMGISLHGSCADGPRIELVDAFQSWIDRWDKKLYEHFWDTTHNRWSVSPIQLFMRESPKFGVLVLDEAAARRLVQSAMKAQASQYVARRGPPSAILTPAQGLAIGTGAVGLAYGGWTLWDKVLRGMLA